ncbi:MAG: hypothetical protein RQ751_08005 [Longimicrobiales bacterium]|nr:hypothetical protein [Longimicrobiales bacterium]
MAALSKVGRFLYAIPMAVFGLLHFMNGAAMAGMVPIPGGVLWVYVTGAALLGAALAVLTGKQAELATRLLGLMLLIFALTIHLPGVMGAPDQMAMMASMSNLLKDTALAGGAWILSGVVGSGAGGGGSA